jgi:hypothetical protein
MLRLLMKLKKKKKSEKDYTAFLAIIILTGIKL